MSLRVEVDESEVFSVLGAMLDRCNNSLPIYASMTPWMMAETRRNFLASQDQYGNAWAPIRHRVGKPLLDTGRLFRSLTASIDKDGASISTNVFYAVFHQFGIGVKQRAFFPTESGGWPAQWIKKAEDSVMDGLLN